MSVQLGLVVLATGNLAASTAFYKSAFGWKQNVAAPSYSEFLLPDRMRLGLYQREGFAKNTGILPHVVPAGAIAPTELYFYADDPEAVLKKAIKAGARLLSPLHARDWGDEVGYCAEPDGNVIAIAPPLGGQHR